MTTIAYYDGCLLSDTRHIVVTSGLYLAKDFKRHKAILIPNEKGEIIGAFGITGKQPSGEQLQKLIEFLSDRKNIEPEKTIPDFNYTGILMYRDVQYAVSSMVMDQKEVMFIGNLIDGIDAVGTGGSLACRFIEEGRPKETIMRDVASFDPLTSPVTCIIYQKDLAE